MLCGDGEETHTHAQTHGGRQMARLREGKKKGGVDLVSVVVEYACLLAFFFLVWIRYPEFLFCYFFYRFCCNAWFVMSFFFF